MRVSPLFPRHREVLLLLLISLLWLLANLVTASRSPMAWMDEVMFSDPAVSFHLGQGFTSTAWYAQTKNDVFAGSPILHQLLLAGWLKIFGLSITSVRSLGYVYVILGTWFIWWAIRRSGWVSRAWLRLLLFAMILTGYGMTFVYRCGRVDSLLILLSGATFFVATLPSKRQRWPALFFLGSAFALTAYHAPVFAASTLILICFFLPGGFWRDVLAFGLGGAAGTSGMLAYLQVQDPEGKIRKAINDLFLSSNRSWPSGIADPSLALLLLLLIFLLWCGRNQPWLKWQSSCVFSLAAVILVPFSVWAVGRYPIYYSWMAWILLVPGVFHAIDASWSQLNRLSKFGTILLVTAAGGIGLPARLAVTIYEWDARDYKPLVELASKHLKADDWVFTEYAGYYAVKPIVEMTATQWFIPAMTDSDKQRLNWLLISPANLELWSNKLGGDWVDSGAIVTPLKGKSKPSLAYQLKLYQRK